jgi:hypothetical protein
MGFTAAALLLLAVVSLHNLEEAIWLPGWLRRHPGPFATSDPYRFRLAVGVLTLLMSALGIWVWSGSPLAAQLAGGVAVAMGFNALVPHLAQSLRTGSVMPGTASGLILVLPASALMLVLGFRSGEFVFPEFALFAVSVPVGMLALVFGLLRIGDGG